MRRVLALFAAQLALWTLVSTLNHALTGWRVYLFPGALYVAFAALLQPRRPGLVVALLGGLVCDAATPVAFGTHTLLFAAAHLILFHLRDRLPKEDNLGLVIVVLFANLALFLVFSLGQIRSSPAPAAVWPRLIADLACTQVFLALVTPWFFALQAQALAFARVPREQGA